MAKRTDIRRILMIGAGPIVIGQACEFDYSGSQACRALMDEGYEVILVNSNPATIMTDPSLATKTYIEPITSEVVTRIITTDKPDAILPTMGGQTALNIAHELHKQGVLEQYNVELIGANFQAIDTAEDRDAFKVIVAQCGLESLKSTTVTTLEEANAAVGELGFPVIIRPAFTLGGSGGSIVQTREAFEGAVNHGLKLSPIDQVLLEESALGWKEYEFEVMRDCRDNVVIVASVENVDPMGIHTGDSMTVAPAMTLSDREYHTLRDASLKIIRAVGVDAGGCNIQFAIHPNSGRVVVIEMNPRVSRSSALVSKATGVPIAKISAKLAVGYTLDEITNDITQTTPACFEPSLDYVVTKIPRFAFEKFPGADVLLSPQMKSVGEVMAIGATFQESFQKALRGLEVGLPGFYFPKITADKATILEKLADPTDGRLHWVYQALWQQIPQDRIGDITGLDPWFLTNFTDIVATERALSQTTPQTVSEDLLRQAKQQGFSDEQLSCIWQVDEATIKELRHETHTINNVYKAVDTCAAEFKAETPYFYGTYDGTENEADDAETPSNKKVVILGGGPNRIGQGIEFDYCCVHAAMSLEKLGYKPIMVNSNPETVSTDYDISHRLYFEPLTPEDVGNILTQEKPLGMIAQLGGQTPLKLSQELQGGNTPFLGTQPEAIDTAEDRDKFSQILRDLNLNAPASGFATTEVEALAIANRIGYPVIVRPSYVLGGRAMRIVYSDATLRQYLNDAVELAPGQPVLVERFLDQALELDVDAVSDGDTTVIGAVMEHIEHAGVHSGDSICVLPTQTVTPPMLAAIEDATHRLAKAINVRGLLNIQFAIQDDVLYVLEVNPRASRTVPFVCKATGLNLIHLAVQVMLGTPLATIKPEQPKLANIAVKAPVFPFIKFKGADPVLGPEMRSTGEVMGSDKTFPMAFAKALLGAGVTLPASGTVFISVNDRDKPAAIGVAKQLTELGFDLLATGGTASVLSAENIPVTAIAKKHEGGDDACSVDTMIEQGDIALVINTPAGEAALEDDSYIRKAAVIKNIPMVTTMPGAQAFAQAMASLQSGEFSLQSLQANQYTSTAGAI